jgi:hypothetical protein
MATSTRTARSRILWSIDLDQSDVGVFLSICRVEVSCSATHPWPRFSGGAAAAPTPSTARLTSAIIEVETCFDVSERAEVMAWLRQ